MDGHDKELNEWNDTWKHTLYRYHWFICSAIREIDSSHSGNFVSLTERNWDDEYSKICLSFALVVWKEITATIEIKGTGTEDSCSFHNANLAYLQY